LGAEHARDHEIAYRELESSAAFSTISALVPRLIGKRRIVRGVLPAL
jgi:hypothetical protein